MYGDDYDDWNAQGLLKEVKERNFTPGKNGAENKKILRDHDTECAKAGTVLDNKGVRQVRNRDHSGATAKAPPPAGNPIHGAGGAEAQAPGPAVPQKVTAPQPAKDAGPTCGPTASTTSFLAMADPTSQPIPSYITDEAEIRAWHADSRKMRSTWLEGCKIEMEKQQAVKAIPQAAPTAPPRKGPVFMRLGGPPAPQVYELDDETDQSGPEGQLDVEYDSYMDQHQRHEHLKEQERARREQFDADMEAKEAGPSGPPGKRKRPVRPPQGKDYEQRNEEGRANMLKVDAPYQLHPTPEQASQGKRLKGGAATPEVVVSMDLVAGVKRQVSERITYELQRGYSWGESSNNRACFRESGDVTHLLKQSEFRLDALMASIHDAQHIKDPFGLNVARQLWAADFLAIIRDIRHASASQIQREMALQENDWARADALRTAMLNANKAGTGATSIFEQMSQAGNEFVPEGVKLKVKQPPVIPFFSAYMVPPVPESTHPRGPRAVAAGKETSATTERKDWTKSAVCDNCDGYGHVVNQCTEPHDAGRCARASLARQRARPPPAAKHRRSPSPRRRSSSPDDRTRTGHERTNRYARESSDRRMVPYTRAARSRSRSRSPAKERRGEKPE